MSRKCVCVCVFARFDYPYIVLSISHSTRIHMHTYKHINSLSVSLSSSVCQWIVVVQCYHFPIASDCLPAFVWVFWMRAPHISFALYLLPYLFVPLVCMLSVNVPWTHRLEYICRILPFALDTNARIQCERRRCSRNRQQTSSAWCQYDFGHWSSHLCVCSSETINFFENKESFLKIVRFQTKVFRIFPSNKKRIKINEQVVGRTREWEVKLFVFAHLSKPSKFSIEIQKFCDNFLMRFRIIVCLCVC